MLSTFNLPGKNISPDKQMSMMRTYLNQLKDEMETELYNIKWENLSKDLQDTINSLKSYSAESDDKINAINANYVSTEYLTSNYITAQQIASTYVTTQYLNANYITASQISAAYATIGSLNAVSAAIDSLEAIAITTDNLSAQTINGSQITAGSITASKISTTANLHINTITADGGYINIPLGTVNAAGLVSDYLNVKQENFTFNNRHVGWVSIDGRYTLCAVE